MSYLTQDPSLCHSWILDVSDASYIRQGHFSRADIKEIQSHNALTIPDIPKHVNTYLQTLKGNYQKTATKLREQLQFPWTELYNRETDYDSNWIFGTMYLMINEYDFGHLKTPHNEQWYQLHIWSMIDRLFAKVSGFGEYGCAEAGSKYEGPRGSKKMIESGLKAPKILKDMINNLVALCQHEEDRVVKLRTIRFIHSELVMEILIMDVPQGYVARLTKSVEYMIPQPISNVNAQLLPLLSVLISIQLLILQVIDIVENRVPAIEHPLYQYKNTFVRQGPPENEVHKRKSLPTSTATPEKRRMK
ncbi:hypothetical protein INT43_007781 [Umbelopsis isabellina]|uniref:Uncharacterized protein n=1 Tax=Mortierella isabellina TaxID=91625 RepID=A0A8H7UBS9_MORIS|nr:hypothetical protein INT43_007781 [Umbelopsis isabellina]